MILFDCFDRFPRSIGESLLGLNDMVCRHDEHNPVGILFKDMYGCKSDTGSRITGGRFRQYVDRTELPVTVQLSPRPGVRL